MEIVVIGGGPAGRTAAMEASGIGGKVTLIEQDKIGGKCLNEGCMVVSGLNDVARFLHDAKNFQNLGITSFDSEISFDKVTSGIEEIICKIREILEFETTESGVEIVRGDAELQDGLVTVGNKEYYYDKLIIATGSRAFIPPIKGVKNAKIYRDILKFREIPDKLIIIGSGVMAAEIAGVFSALGSDVHILCRNIFLKMLDDDIKKYVVENLLEEVNILENVEIKWITNNGIITDKGNIDGTVLLAVGMVPNSEIGDGMVDIGAKGEIIVNNMMETSKKDIYAAGDVVGGIANTPVARMEGVVAARNACGVFAEVDYRFIPYAISLYYDVAFLGSENSEEGVGGYIPGSAGPGSFWRVADGKTGLTKVQINAETGEILKLFSVAPSSRIVMAYMSKMLRNGVKVEDFDDFIETHPSTDAVYKLMGFFAKNL